MVRTDWYGQEAGALAGGKNAPGMLRDKWPQSNPNYRVKKIIIIIKRRRVRSIVMRTQTVKSDRKTRRRAR